MKRNKISASISGAIGIVVAAGALSSGFVSADDHAETVEEIVVTGSRLQSNPNLAGAVPVLTVSGEEADLRGNVRIEDFVNILPQVFAGQASEVSYGASGTATVSYTHLTLPTILLV